MENTMSNLIRVKLVCAMVGFCIWPAMENVNGQGGRADYERALGLRAATANKVFKQQIRPNWSSDNTRFWYRNDLADGEREFVMVAVKAGKLVACDQETTFQGCHAAAFIRIVAPKAPGPLRGAVDSGLGNPEILAVRPQIANVPSCKARKGQIKKDRKKISYL